MPLTKMQQAALDGDEAEWLRLRQEDQLSSKEIELQDDSFPPTWSTGTIRVFFPEKGYGFIKPNCGGLDVWFHIQDRVNKDYFPREGELLTYLTRLGPKGTLIAKQWDMVVETVKGKKIIIQGERG